MPPPISRPTVLSATRASIVDEKKRLERVTADTQNGKINTQSAGPKSMVFGTAVTRNVSNPTGSDPLQKNRGDIPEDRAKSRGVAGRLSETGIKYEKGKNSLSPVNDSKKYDPAKYQDDSSQSGFATGGGSSTGILPKSQKDGEMKNTSIPSKHGGGQSSGATGISSKGLPSNDKFQSPRSYVGMGVPDPYGYAKISASDERFFRNNLDFYKNKINSKPGPGYKIEDMLKWKGNYSMLERNHQYIQWLFPIPEGNGLNLYAQQLYEHEAKAIRDDDTAHKRVLSAFKMMLDFYGMQLANSIHGTLKRSSKGWEERYDHLNRSRHNYLRITRILKSIGELGYERLQAPWVEFLIEEAVNKKELPNLNGPCLMHWIMAVKDDGERERLYRKASGLDINRENTTYGTNSESEEEEDEEGVVETRTEQVLDQSKLALSKMALENDENKTGSVSQCGKYEVTTTAMCKQKNDAEFLETASATVPVQTDEKPEEIQVKGKNQITKKSDNADETSTERNSVSTAVQTCGKESPTESPQGSDNLKFYQNNLLSRPSPGYTIETMLKYKGQYIFFDEYPGFIHWLFPVPETTGRNKEAQPLYKHEAEAIRNDDELNSRVREAFNLILDFFGMRIYDDLKGKFRRSKRTYEERYEYLQRYKENYLRITRIIISIGELGLERFQVPWVTFLISEGIDNAMFQTLDGECIKHWISAIKDDGEKHAMFRKYQNLLGHKALIAFKEKENREVDMEVDNDVYIGHSIGRTTKHDTDINFEIGEGSWGFDSHHFV